MFPYDTSIVMSHTNKSGRRVKTSSCGSGLRKSEAVHDGSVKPADFIFIQERP